MGDSATPAPSPGWIDEIFDGVRYGQAATVPAEDRSALPPRTHTHRHPPGKGSLLTTTYPAHATTAVGVRL